MGKKTDKRRIINPSGAARMEFSGMHMYYDTSDGTTQLTFFNVPKSYRSLAKNKNASLFESFFYNQHFVLVGEKYSKRRKEIDYTVTLQARQVDIFKENISILLSNILRRQVMVDHTAPMTNIIGVMFRYDNTMYLPEGSVFMPAGNPTSVSFNEQTHRVAFYFDLAKVPVVELFLSYDYN
ncbi:MAG: hypothetical protein LBS64_03355 [Spirochaetaceae bacterium]|nr:hypothetical protein [Spirochaetaceae bacterium]